MPPAEALDSEYENGVADVLAYLAGTSAQVKRNVRLPGRLSGARRQIDVLVRGRVYAHEAATLIVDAKRWRPAVDVADVGSFIDLVKDVEADYGLLVTNRGSSKGGGTRALNEPGVQVEAMPVEQLLAWRPMGTFTIAYGVSAVDVRPAARALRRAGFRVTESTQWTARDDSPVIEIFRHYGTTNPGPEVQSNALAVVERVLARARVEGTLVAHGVIAAGGTPSHRWLDVTVSGEPCGITILATTEADADEQLERWGATQGLPQRPSWVHSASRVADRDTFPSLGGGRRQALLTRDQFLLSSSSLGGRQAAASSKRRCDLLGTRSKKAGTKRCWCAVTGLRRCRPAGHVR